MKMNTGSISLRLASMLLLGACNLNQQKTARTPEDIRWPDLKAPITPVGGGEADSAVIVGIETYRSLDRVPGAVDNAEAWRRYMTNVLQVPAHRVKLLKNETATRGNILRWLRDFSKLTTGRVWLVFIGHGDRTQRDDPVLLGETTPVDDRLALEDHGVTLNEAIAIMESDGTTQPVLVLDACYTGNRAKIFRMSTSMVNPPLAKSAVVLSASGRYQETGRLPGDGRPAFSYLVLGALRGWGSEEGDTTITAEDAINYAANALVVTSHKSESIPEVSAGNGAIKLANSGTEIGPDLNLLAEKLSGGEDFVPKRPERPAQDPLLLAGAVSLGTSIVPTSLAFVGMARARSLEEDYNNSCSMDGSSAYCKDLDRQGALANRMQIAGFIAAPLLIAAGSTMLGIALKRRRVARQAFMPIFGGRSVGVTWTLRF